MAGLANGHARSRQSYHFKKIEQALQDEATADGIMDLEALSPMQIHRRLERHMRANGLHDDEIPSMRTLRRFLADRKASAVPNEASGIPPERIEVAKRYAQEQIDRLKRLGKEQKKMGSVVEIPTVRYKKGYAFSEETEVAIRDLCAKTGKARREVIELAVQSHHSNTVDIGDVLVNALSSIKEATEELRRVKGSPKTDEDWQIRALREFVRMVDEEKISHKDAVRRVQAKDALAMEYGPEPGEKRPTKVDCYGVTQYSHGYQDALDWVGKEMVTLANDIRKNGAVS